MEILWKVNSADIKEPMKFCDRSPKRDFVNKEIEAGSILRFPRASLNKAGPNSLSEFRIISIARRLYSNPNSEQNARNVWIEPEVRVKNSN